MATQTPSIETLKRGLNDFASAATDRPPTIRQMVHDLHEEIEAALRGATHVRADRRAPDEPGRKVLPVKPSALPPRAATRAGR